jgi:hypothetical protein
MDTTENRYRGKTELKAEEGELSKLEVNLEQSESGIAEIEACTTEHDNVEARPERVKEEIAYCRMTIESRPTLSGSSMSTWTPS